MIPAPSPLPLSVSRFVLRRADYDAGTPVSFAFMVENRDTNGAILHVRFSGAGAGVGVLPDETALAPGEKQNARLLVGADAMKRAGGDTAAFLPVTVSCTYLHPAAPPVKIEGTLSVRLPVATCPNCQKIVSDDDAQAGVPPVCPFCYERLRPCPVCGLPNSWLARACVNDPAHIVRAEPDFGVSPGGDAGRGGSRPALLAVPVLSRRWSFPSVAPVLRESVLSFTAPVAAYGMVAIGTNDYHGDAHLMAWDARTGATLWEPFPLDKPVYPERGAPAIAGGKLFAASIEGVCVCLDALRGTRIWETRLPTPVQVYGAVLPVTISGAASGDATATPDVVLVPATLGADKSRGAVFVLSAETGQILREIPLRGRTDTASTFADGLAFAHDDVGCITAFDPLTGTIVWQETADAGFDAAPVCVDNGVFSAGASGTLSRRDARTGAVTWQLSVTNAPLSGTPVCDGVSVYVPADDGLHVVSASTGRSVRRFGGKRPVRASPVVTAGGTVFWGATDGAIYGVRGNSPAEPLYDPRTPGAQFATPLAVADGAIFAASTNGVLFALAYGAAQK